MKLEKLRNKTQTDRGMTLPPNYKEGITRTTSIVGFVFPFKGTDGEARYKRWLKDKNIKEEEYLEGAQNMGTLVHNSLEDYIKTGHHGELPTEVNKEYYHGYTWLDQLKYKSIETELYVREKDERFQGAVDLLYTDKEGKIVLADWKTYGIVKKRYGLDNKFIVPTAKRKKVQLQMSIYCYALRQQGIEVDRIELLFLHEDGIKVIELNLLSDVEIETILTTYEQSLKPEVKENNINIALNNMIVTIQSPTGTAYEHVVVTVDMYKEEDGKTTEQKINEAVAAAIYTKKVMSEGPKGVNK